MVVYGLLVLILPYFGLQFRKVLRHHNGENSWMLGYALIAFGMSMGGVVIFRREVAVALKYALRASLILVGIAASVLVLGMVLARLGVLGPRRHLPAAVPPATAPEFPWRGPPVGPQPGVPWWPAPGPAGPQFPPLVDDPAKPGFIERWRAGFGAVHFARVRLIGTAGIADPEALARRLGSFRDPGPDPAMSTWVSDDRAEVLLMPVRDLDAFAAKIDFGTIAGIDRQRRLITVTVDPTASAKGGGKSVGSR
jgi:hypothetical protein